MFSFRDPLNSPSASFQVRDWSPSRALAKAARRTGSGALCLHTRRLSVADYQADAVAGYLNTLGSTNEGLFNLASTQADGATLILMVLQGQNVQIVVGTENENAKGPSCSSPIFASAISLINDDLIAVGKSPLVDQRPFQTNGFPATVGWDPVTGLGTPNFAALKAAAGL
ncbi:hypothetical protein K438DRAFT_1953687 [Mycena galopus ATCC 62051]|nr:hypothetical protein K438DRAFT_1953687 [Mycena galopus ATCC 62051]